MLRQIGSAGIIAMLLCAAPAADAGPKSGPPGRVGACAEAAIAEIRLPTASAVDEIRVVVSDDSPELGAAKVVVEAGEFDRALYVHGGSHGLSFSTPLSGAEFRVSLDPILSAPETACVDSIELRSRGRLVAAVKP